MILKNLVTLSFILLITCFSSSTTAQGYTLSAPDAVSSSDVVQYLSEEELIEISQEAVEERLQRATDPRGRLDSRRDSPRVTQFFVYGTANSNSPNRRSKTSDDSFTTRASQLPWVGTINCYRHSTALRVDHPHATNYWDFPDGQTRRVVKAKSSGQCVYSHIQGTPPSFITYHYLMLLARIRGERIDRIFSKLHTKTAISPAFRAEWRSGRTDVVSNRCIDGDWLAAGVMYIGLPQGYRWAGPAPWVNPSFREANVYNCF